MHAIFYWTSKCKEPGETETSNEFHKQIDYLNPFPQKY